MQLGSKRHLLNLCVDEYLEAAKRLLRKKHGDQMEEEKIGRN